jgi:hypothetical protein
MDAARLHLPDFFPFWSPDTPDLGCFIERKHGLETYDFHVYGEPSPWRIVGDTLTFIDHQAYFRVKCGHAGHYQRCLVYMRAAGAGSQDVLGATPDWVLGGDFLPYPSDWLKYPPQTVGRTYFFAGEHRSPSSTAWLWDEAVGHTYDLYDNGTLATVCWDDTGGDRDFDDFVVEVAVVRRRRFFVDLVLAERDAGKLSRFVEEIEPKLEQPDRSYEGD